MLDLLDRIVGNPIKAMCALSFAVLLWYLAIDGMGAVRYELETKRALAGARIYEVQNAVHCNGS